MTLTEPVYSDYTRVVPEGYQPGSEPGTLVDGSGQVWITDEQGQPSFTDPVYSDDTPGTDATSSGRGIAGDPTGGGDGQMSGWESTTVNPDGSSVSVGTGTFPDDSLDGVGNASSDLGDLSGIDLSGVNDVVGDIAGSGVPIGAAAGAAYDLLDGNYERAAEEGLIGVADVGADALGLPGIDSDIGVLSDLVDGNTGALVGDAETAAIETGASLAGAAVGSVLGPIGTVAGAAIGNFVGDAVAPSVEDAVSDTVKTAGDVLGDTETAVSNAGTDFGQGNILGGVGDIVGGAAEDVVDVATGAVDVAGDAVEGVGDVASAVGGLVGDVGSGAEDVVDDVGDAADDLGDDIESLF